MRKIAITASSFGKYDRAPLEPSEKVGLDVSSQERHSGPL